MKRSICLTFTIFFTCYPISNVCAADYYVEAIAPLPVAPTGLVVPREDFDSSKGEVVFSKNNEQQLPAEQNNTSPGEQDQQEVLDENVSGVDALPSNYVKIPALSAPEPGLTYPSFDALLQSGRLRGGDRVFLQGGHHGKILVKNIDFKTDVIIAAMPGSIAQVDGINVRGSSNIIFRDLKVWATSPGTTQVAAIRTDKGSHDITFAKLDVRSVAAADNYLEWDITGWNENTRGGFLVDGARIKIVENRLTGTANSILAQGPSALIEANFIDGWGNDAMRALGDNSTVRGNLLQNCFHISGNHDDGFQSFSRGPSGKPGTGTVRNLVVEGNKIFEWRSELVNPLRCKLQGIGLFDGMYENIAIRNNLISVSGYHGITVSGVKGAVIVQNTVVNSFGKSTPFPRIKVAPHKNGTLSSNVIVANNISNAVRVKSDQDRNIVVANNVTVTNLTSEFSSVEHQDFTLSKTAKARAMGAIEFAPPTDILGLPRPEGKTPDAGAFQAD